MRLHFHKARPAAFHEGLATSREDIKKARWDPEEVHLMAAWEVELISQVCRFLITPWLMKFPAGRSRQLKGNGAVLP